MDLISEASEWCNVDYLIGKGHEGLEMTQVIEARVL